MPTKRKIEPCIILSRQSLEATVADIVTLKLDHATATAAMETEIAEVQKKHQDGLLNLNRQIETREAGVFVYCQRNRKELFPEKKSLDLLLAVIGFENPPSSVKKNSKSTWGQIALRLEGLDWGGPYVRYPDVEVNKEKLLADRKTLTEEQLNEAGIGIDQEEHFFIRPKSDIAEQTVKDAA